jgi:polyisoprenoid-binding protein YceI
MLKHILASFSIVCCMSSSIAVAAGKCEFFAKASVGILEFTGTGCVVEGSPKVEGGKVSGEFSVDLSKLDTGMGLRNDHMRDNYLEVKKFPKATLKLDPMPEAGGSFAGKLTLHGVEKPVSGTAKKEGAGWAFKFDVNTKDFGMKQADYKGIVIGESISISGSIDK